MQQFKGVIEEQEATQGYIVTTSRFTREAQESAAMSPKIILGDIEQLCNRVIIIDQGRVHFDGELEDLRSRVGRRTRMRLELLDPTTSQALANTTAGLPVTWEEGEGLRHHAEFNRAEIPAAEVIKRLVAECHVQDFHLSEAAIEEVVREIYRQGGEQAS